MKAGTYEALASRTEADVSDDLLRRVYCVDLVGETQLDRLKSADLLHAILGVTGEVSEYMRIDQEAPGADEQERKELGDIWWYARMIPRCFGYDIGRFVELVRNEFQCMREAAEELANRGEFPEVRLHVSTDDLTEALKKWLFYGKPIDGIVMIAATAKILAHAMYFRQGIGIDDFDRETEAIWEANIEKLQRRFPMAFDQVLAKSHDGQ